MQKRNLVRTNVFLTPEQRDWLAEQSRKTDVPTAALIRRGIERLRTESIAAGPHLGEAAR